MISVLYVTVGITHSISQSTFNPLFLQILDLGVDLNRYSTLENLQNLHHVHATSARHRKGVHYYI
jgi:hypothetical protein